MLNIWQDHHPLYFPPEDVQIGQRQGKARHSADIPMSLLYGIKSQFKQKVRSFWIGFYDIHPTNHTKTRFSCRQMPLHFFTAIQSWLCGKQSGKDSSWGAVSRLKLWISSAAHPGIFHAVMKGKLACFLPVTAFATAGLLEMSHVRTAQLPGNIIE